MPRHLLPLLLLLATLLAFPTSRVAAKVPAPAPPETPAERDARMAWFRDARFGMFVHWGLYALPAGEWNGKVFKDPSEWLMCWADASRAEYEPLAAKFNPVDYNPAEWVRIAKDAGMKYVVITSKHHDGFCLFDTQATNYDAVDASPHGQDLLKPLADECRKQGLHFCTYYSIMDWHHPTQVHGPNGWSPTTVAPENKAEYVQYMKTQLAELINSCDPEVLWFDGEWCEWWTEEDGRALYAYLRNLKPSLIINNRVGKGRQGLNGFNKGDQTYSGDFGTPEQEIPAKGVPGVDWESCMTMNGSWGFHQHDANWKSADTLIKNVVDTASKGGNYLLNVGPTAAGKIPPESVERLAAIGQWIRVNGDAIYGTTASPCRAPDWGRVTRKGDRLFLHVFDWPSDGRLELPINVASVGAARLLADPSRALTAEPTEAGIAVQLTGAAPDEICSVVELEFSGEPTEIPKRTVRGPDGSLVLAAQEANHTGLLFVESIGGEHNLGNWTDANDHADWEFSELPPGRYAVTVEVAAPSAARLQAVVDDQEVAGDITPTGNFDTFAVQSLGELEIKSTGKQSLSLRPVADGWSPINVRNVTLRPVAP